MNQVTDEYLIAEIKQKKDNDSLIELISRHSGIYVEMIKRYGQRSLSENQINDLMNDKDFNIYSAALEYDESKSKFSTYLANMVRYNCLSNKTLNKKNSKFINFDDFVETEQEQDLDANNPCQISSNKEFLKKVCFLIEQHEDFRVREIFRQRYFDGDTKKLKPWKYIAQELNLSIQGCIVIHNRTIKELQKIIKNEKITL